MIPKYIRYVAMAMVVVPALIASAQNVGNDKFSVKATADMGMGNSLSTDYNFPGMTSKSSSSDFGVEFGCAIWQQKRHSLELNAGLGYGSISLKADVLALDYHYNAPAEADMDQETYIRYYELDGVHQKIKTERITIPLYLNYRFQLNRMVSFHALLGYKFGFNFSPKVTEVSGNVFCYGVYPQYGDLLIDASYMNMFGESTLSDEGMSKPELNTFTPSFMAGVGVEFCIWGPLAVDVSLRYEDSMTDIFKARNYDIVSFDASDAPMTYLVAEGQKVKPLSSYLSTSKLSRLSLAASLVYRF